MEIWENFVDINYRKASKILGIGRLRLWFLLDKKGVLLNRMSDQEKLVILAELAKTLQSEK